MSERELREKYGGKLAKAINRAIRAEIPGGNEALDTLTQLAGPALHSGWKDGSGEPTPEATAYYRHKRNVVDKMEATIRRNWDIPQEVTPPRRPPRRPGPASKSSRPARPRDGSRSKPR